LLDVTRLQQGRLDLHPEPVDLIDLARQALAHCQHLPEYTPRHRLTLEGPESLAGVWDSTRLDQVLMNLLSNALKYSPDGGEVRVAIRRVGEQAEIAIRDDGLGMTPEARAALFRPFARAEAIRPGISGLGLGLYITAQLVEQHRGSLALESEPGRGCTVTVRLPLPPAATG
jgi:signal transduction histidine kinase